MQEAAARHEMAMAETLQRYEIEALNARALAEEEVAIRLRNFSAQTPKSLRPYLNICVGFLEIRVSHPMESGYPEY